MVKPWKFRLLRALLLSDHNCDFFISNSRSSSSDRAYAMVSATKELTFQVKKDYNQASSEHHPRTELETRSRAVISSMHRKAHPGIDVDAWT
jgi:hypothetical protein